MILELAPMEGITTYIYRNAFNKYYGGIDRYYTPFISTHKDKELNFKEKNEIRPENNKGITLIPQILTADADEFLYTSSQIRQYGYNYVNLNFGCPSGTVTAKGKGSGILTNPEILERLLDAIFSKTDMKISVKTRLGYSSEEEWERILSVYKKFPIEELIIHARVREDFYKGAPRMRILEQTLAGNDAQVTLGKIKSFSYNGDIACEADIDKMVNIIPSVSVFMIGRGLIANPALAAGIKDGSVGVNAIRDIGTFKAFNLELIEKYGEIMPGEKNTLFKLKELWVYMSGMFDDPHRILKKIQKTKTLRDYELIIKTLDSEI